MARTPFKEDLYSKLLSSDTNYKFVSEFYFHPKRRWRFDYCCPELKIAVEIEGGAFSQGRHTRGVGFIKDMEKYNNATLLGYKLLRFTPDQKNKIDTIDMIKLLCRY